ncbi:unnamed protein product [marine sediment metagenome]|uniref:Uncharacterized protein n=1 Tax=marine sediment metagenome TaxID=412755 RepID=X1J5Q0_9ZZZZ
MTKRKYPSELNTRSIRVNIGDYHLLMELARLHDTTVAKVLHLAITKQAERELVVTPRTQIPMPINFAFQVTDIPVPAVRIAPVMAIATNGSGAAAFRIKPKGVAYGDQRRSRR